MTLSDRYWFFWNFFTGNKRFTKPEKYSFGLGKRRVRDIFYDFGLGKRKYYDDYNKRLPIYSIFKSGLEKR